MLFLSKEFHVESLRNWKFFGKHVQNKNINAGEYGNFTANSASKAVKRKKTIPLPQQREIRSEREEGYMLRRRHRTGMLILAVIVVMLAAGIFSAPDAKAEEAQEAASEAENGTRIEAGNVDEFLNAIAPDTTIVLTGYSYDLTCARGYGVYGSRYYRWNNVYDDGWELEIENVSNLKIVADHRGTEIITEPRYACVLRLSKCRDLLLDGFTIGHSEGEGYCTGAVLGIQDCEDVRIENCDLYGCGTYGLEMERCKGVHTISSIIRNCSYGALTAASCEDILLDRCAVYEIEGFSGLFTMSACRDCAVINSLVRNCRTESLTNLTTVRDFYMGGCEIRRNSFDGVFSSSPYSFVVEACAFEGNECVSGGWYDESWRTSERAVTPEGEEYRDEQLEELRRQNVSWSAPERPEETVSIPETGEDGMVHVKNVDEFLAAIAPDRTIYLEDGIYDLSEAKDYGYGGGEYWYWMSSFDGPGLAIRSVDNLTIKAAGPHRTRIVAVPRYCEVLSFEDCEGLTLYGFTAGHTESLDDIGCAGGVISFMECRNFTVEDCSLYGCGVMGITGISSSDGIIRHTEIHDCVNGAFYFYDSRRVEINECNIHDIADFTYQIYDCEGITSNGERLPGGASW